ncbi:MAG: N-acetylglucosamine-6-phosphate deacetylase [Clostridiales bacterium]|nr:N-acetylglucosamine-6-phosphate deacetylase [Clostridiales bacterium]
MGITKILNGRIITPYRLLDDAAILVENGRIVEVSKEAVTVKATETIDANGKYISPGFIDIHTHGGGGHDFMDGNPDVFKIIAKKHANYGTTMLFPTLTSSRFEVLKKSIANFDQLDFSEINEARMPGLHLEGPYFSMEQRGAQDARYVRHPQKEEYMEILGMTDSIARWSLAPELPGTTEFSLQLQKRGIVPAIGHSNATYEEMLSAYERGFELVTHLYSGCSIMRRINAYRVAGVVESAFLIDGMYVEIIADGHHLPESLLKLIVKNKGISKIALITDSVRAAGDPAMETIVGDKETGIKAIVEDGVAKLPDRSAFAGSVATADRCIKTMVGKAEVSVINAVEMMTATPAKIMNVYDRAGSLSPGKYADIVFFDDKLDVKFTMIGGRVIFEEK